MQKNKERSPARAIWWQAAAVLLLISVGLWFFVRLDGPEKKSVARVEEDTTTATNALAPSAASPVATTQGVSSADTIKSVASNQRVALSKKTSAPPARRPAILAQTGADSLGYFATNEAAPQAARATAMNPNTAWSGRQDSIKNLDVVMTPLPNMESKEVVMKRGETSKSKTVREFVIADTLEPTEGIARYNDYVASNLKQPDALPGKPQSGAVRLSFDVDESGSPINIAVVKSDCPACDKEAIRLVSEGPKWKKKKGKKGAITITF
jgi:TonB family protein